MLPNFLSGNSLELITLVLQRKNLADFPATNHTQERWQQAKRNKMKNITTLILTLLTIQCYCQVSQESVSIKIHDIKGYGQYEEFARKSVEKLQTLLNSESFKNEFTKTKMTQMGGYSKTELLSLIVQANELRGNSEGKNTIDIRLRTMSYEEDGERWMKNCAIGSRAGTIGKEADKSGYTITCQERIKIWAEHENYGCMAGHIMHEYLHNLGFKHKWYSKRKSFVYKTGDLTRNLINGNSKPCPTK